MTSRFDLMETGVAGVTVLQLRPVTDDRGFLERLFCADELRGAAPWMTIAQVNRTMTRRRGTVRGLHFQYPPHAEAKLVYCLRGEIYDVALDLRKGSPTFLKWHAELLSDSRRRMLFVPEGCAHGFQALTDRCEVLYFHSVPYAPEAEGGVNALDPRLAITWPEPVTERSARDVAYTSLSQDFAGITA